MSAGDEKVKVVGPDLVSSWPDWMVQVVEGRMAKFACKSCPPFKEGKRPTKYLCSLPLSNGAKAVLRDHTKRHGPAYAPEIERDDT